MRYLKYLTIVLTLFPFFLAHAQKNLDQYEMEVDSILDNAVTIINQNADLANDKMNLVIKNAKAEGWPIKEAYGHMYRGISLFYLGDYPEALRAYLTSKNIFDSLSFYKGQAKISNELGVFFSRQQNYEEAYKFYENAQIIAEANNLHEELAISLSNQGQSYFKREMYDQSYPLVIKALSIKEKIGDSVGIGYELKRLAAYSFVKKEYDQGLKYLEESSKIRRQLNDKKGLAINQVTVSEMYQQRGLFRKAIGPYQQTLKLSEEIGYVDLSRYVYNMLEECYLNLKDYQRAYENQKKSQALSDSLINKSKVEAITEMQAKYETAQKEQEIANQQLEITSKESAIKSQRLQIYGLISGLVILLLAGFILYNQYKSKQQQKLQVAILEEKQRGFETVLTATEEERSRISKELHDGIGQQLSALKLGLNSVSKSIADENQKAQLEEIATSFSKSAEEVRHISHQMMPRALMEKGLVEAIEDLLQSSFQYAATTYTFEHHNINGRFEERIEVSIYRVIQELINNIIKHAGAQTVTVQLIKQKGNLLLFLEDNGKGMNEESTDGHGLLNIKSRLDMINGTVNWSPGSEQGTFVTVKIAL